VPDVLQVWEANFAAVEEGLAEWNDWYDNEHMAAILTVPRLRRGWRLRREGLPAEPGFEECPEYMAVYLLDSCAVLSSPEYEMARRSVGPGMRPEWTQRMFSVMRDLRRGLYECPRVAPIRTAAAGDLWWVRHESDPTSYAQPRDGDELILDSFRCSTVDRGAGPVTPAAGSARLSLSRLPTPDALRYRTIFVADGA